MAFYEDAIFPANIAYNSVGGPTYATTVVASAGGFEQRNQQWAQARREYELGLTNRSGAETMALVAFFQAVAKGRANGFRFLDFLAGEHAVVGGSLGTGDGTRRTWPLVKLYVVGSLIDVRPTTKPVTGTVALYLGGVLTGAYSLDTTTGLVTFVDPPGTGVVITGDWQFHVPVRFDTDALLFQRIDDDVYSWPSSVKLVELKQ